MRPDELIALLRNRPYSPLRIHITGGKAYDIRRPDQVIVLRGRVEIGVGSNPDTGAVETVEHLSLVQGARVEILAPASSDG
jgi:hypothetical protein